MSRVKWRWAGLRPTIPIFPGVGVSPYAFVPLVIFLFWWSWITFDIACAAIILSIGMAIRGYTVARLASMVKHLLRGKLIRARPWWYLNRYAPPGNRVGLRRSDLTYVDEGDE